MTGVFLDGGVFLNTMDWVTRLFWTIDIGWSCLTGVVLADGTVMFELTFILKRYLKTWFALDVFIVGSDWIEEILKSTGGEQGGIWSKIIPTFRFVRVARLLRLVRMSEVVA